jgi:putative transposase
MAKSPVFTLTPAAVLGLFFIQRYRFLTIAQFARASGLSRHWAEDLLRALELRGMLGYFGHVLIPGHGKTPKAYYLKRKRPCAKCRVGIGAGKIAAESNGMEARMRRRRYPSDLTDPQWALVSPHVPPAKAGGRPRTTEIRAVFDAILYLLRTGCQWRQLPADLPPWPTVHGYFRRWRLAGFWTVLHRALYPLARAAAGRNPGPTVAIMDGQSVKTSEKGAFAASMATSG